MWTLDLEPPEAELLHLLLAKELEETRVEARHTRTHDFKEQLHERERCLRALLEKLPAFVG